jgi:preprotein translocase subunit SecF
MARKSTSKRLQQKYSKKNPSVSAKKVGPETTHHKTVTATKESTTWYDKYYKSFLIIPFVMLLIAFLVIANVHSNTGDYFYKGISLSGGTAVTITSEMADISTIDTQELRTSLLAEFTNADVVVRSQEQVTERIAVEVEVDITDEAELETFKQGLIERVPGLTLEEINQNSSISGSALGDAFVSQIFKAMLVAFLLMGIVVFIQFRVPVPSLAVILAAFSDIVVTLAVINILGIKVSTAGIAAFLMLIGYSVDTDIMLSTRVLKSTEGTVNERIWNAFKTGMTMNITTLAAVTVGLLVSKSAVITQIMTIIFIGLVVDMINTWLQNASILKWYMSRKEVKK